MEYFGKLIQEEDQTISSMKNSEIYLLEWLLLNQMIELPLNKLLNIHGSHNQFPHILTLRNNSMKDKKFLIKL